MSDNPTLQEGDSGEWVTYAQALLTNAGYPPQGDGEPGSYGPLTKEAVRDFQGMHHLTVDGVIGPKTWDALENPSGSGSGSGSSSGSGGAGGGHDYRDVGGDHPTLQRGDGGEWVSYLQQLLTSAGTPPSDGLIDGKFGPNTEEAVKHFQQAHGLTADGVVGQQTWEALENPSSSGGAHGSGGGTGQLEFGSTRPHIHDGGLEWTVRNSGSGAVSAYSHAGAYEFYRDGNTIPGDNGILAADLHPHDESGTIGVVILSYCTEDGDYQASVQVGNEIEYVDFKIENGEVRPR